MAYVLLDFPDSVWTLMETVNVNLRVECKDSSNVFKLITRYTTATKQVIILMEEYGSCIAHTSSIFLDREELMLPAGIVPIAKDLWTRTVKEYAALIGQHTCKSFNPIYVV